MRSRRVSNLHNAVLMASYSYYLQNYYSLAIENLKRYFKTYPKDKNMAYAHYLLAMCYYEIIEGEKKDLAPLILSKKELIFIIENYPDTDYAYDARFKIDLINDILAAKERSASVFFLAARGSRLAARGERTWVPEREPRTRVLFLAGWNEGGTEAAWSSLALQIPVFFHKVRA